MIVLRILFPVLVGVMLIGLFLYYIKPKIMIMCKKRELDAINDIKHVASLVNPDVEGGSLSEDVVRAATKIAVGTDAADRARKALNS